MLRIYRPPQRRRGSRVCDAGTRHQSHERFCLWCIPLVRVIVQRDAPRHPTSALPGTAAKVEVLIARHRRGEMLWHSSDAKLAISDVDEPTISFELLSNSKVYTADGRVLPAGNAHRRTEDESCGRRGRMVG